MNNKIVYQTNIYQGWFKSTCQCNVITYDGLNKDTFTEIIYKYIMLGCIG